jgi:hypothetical protein
MTELPFDMEPGDGALIAKALREYRPETSEEEGTINFYIDQFGKLDEPDQGAEEDPSNIWRGAAMPFADNY